MVPALWASSGWDLPLAGLNTGEISGRVGAWHVASRKLAGIKRSCQLIKLNELNQLIGQDAFDRLFY
jgi:hypothetical protein